ncbi:MAG: N-acetylglucosamine-specific PTS transporter subunit IIBC [Elusimicrobiaceae bacterium]|nr:N-acetylglucosamine-specific PTS transporter subunit IIBC [Elusimicrobiaceae bacterium]
MNTLKKYVGFVGAGLTQLGRALMLPIAVLPVAGLLLRLGQPDLLNIAFLSQAGGAIFNNLPVIFALGVAISFARENHGAAALAAFVGYTIMTAALQVLDASINMGVLGGILAGTTAGLLYNRCHAVKLPPYLAFFGGRRFVPIVTGAVCLLIAGLAYFVWPPIGQAIGRFGQWTIDSGSIGLFFYGLANRLLIPLGLHHSLNNLVWFQFGDFATVQQGVQTIVHGDLTRFFAGDSDAGAFMAGFFPIMMFGLPAACLAMIQTAHTTRKKATAGLLLSIALTSFLTGITEPVEFAFMFLAFPLYVLHAVLTGLSMVLMHALHVKLGFTFSAGLFDYLLNYGLSSRPLWLLPIGLAYGVLYYLIFRFVIVKWNLKTPGREDLPPAVPTTAATPAPTFSSHAPLTRAEQYVAALGGKDNIKVWGACATRLRLEVADPQQVDEPKLKMLGARGVIKTQTGSVQVVIGTDVEILLDEMKPFLN